MSSWWTWVSPDGLTAVEINPEGCHLRKRSHLSDMWEAPELLEPAAGEGMLLVSDLGITEDEGLGPPDFVLTFPIPRR